MSSSSRFARTLGLLGGVGPRATVAALSRVLDAAHARGARRNEDFPRVVSVFSPMTDATAPDGILDSLREPVRDEARRLRASGADVLLLACNSLHAHLDVLRADGGEWVSLVDVACDAAVAAGARRVAVLGTRATSRHDLYGKALAVRGCELASLDDSGQRALDPVIERLIAASPTTEDRQLVERLVLRARDEGADAVVLGCTELSTITTTVAAIDALSLAIEVALDRCSAKS